MVSRRTLYVLVVDNDELVCAATTGVLEFLGCRADAVTGSLRALRAFSDQPDKFDLAVIEPVMPEITGLELAVRFRRIRPGFPVIFYAACVDEPLARGIEADGFGPAILKSLIPEELAKEIERKLHLRIRGVPASPNTA
jgi:CheY-like chemotaxis protein